MKTFFKFISLFLSSCQHIIQQILYIQCFLSLYMLYLSYANENFPCQKKKKNILHSWALSKQSETPAACGAVLYWINE